MKKIVLTGGGTAGHVTPNIALLPALQAAGYEIAYVGSYEGIEKKLIADFNIPYTGISTGKFRRYLDPKNFSDPFRVMKGFVEARNYLKNYQPDVVFSKGGFVSVPVVRAAASLHIPCIIHESDMTPGLANKLCIPVAEKVCCNFPETMKNIPADKAVLTGKKLEKKFHRTHSGWIGGLKETQYKTLMAEASDKAMTYAVKGMVPSNTLGAKAMTRLHCYKAADHAHAAQKPEAVEI